MTTATVKAPVTLGANGQRITRRMREALTLLNLHFAVVAILAVVVLYLLVHIVTAWSAAHSDDAAALAVVVRPRDRLRDGVEAPPAAACCGVPGEPPSADGPPNVPPLVESSLSSSSSRTPLGRARREPANPMGDEPMVDTFAFCNE